MIRAKQQETNPLGFDGTAQDFETIFKTLYAALCRYALMHVKDTEEAEDVVQHIFVKLWQQKDQLRPENLKSYLYRSVYHECVNRARHSQVKATYMDHNLRDIERNSQESHDPALGKELEQRIREAIEHLPEQCGNAFKLSRFHHLTYAEIAEVMHISIKTVENHMGKALGLLRARLSDYLVLFFLFTQIYN